MKKITKIPGILLIISIMFALFNPGYGQDTSPPELLNATIINEDGDVLLSWKITDTVDINIEVNRDSFYIESYTPVKLIADTNITTWTDTNSKANNKTRSYILRDDPEQTYTLRSNSFNTIHASVQFDTCKKSMSLTWSKHIPLTPLNNFDFNDTISIKYFNIWKSTDGSSYQKIATTEDTSFTDTDVFYNHTYKYFIESVRQADTSIKSKSNRMRVETRMPYNPDYIHTDFIKSNPGSLILKYSIAPNSELKEYYLLRSDYRRSSYDTIKKSTTSGYELSYEDKNIDPDKQVFYYQVVSVNQCNDLTTRSDTLNNILLEVNNENLTNKISWNHVTGNQFQSKEYEIYRKIGNNNYSFYQNTFNNTYYDNELNLLRGKDSSGYFCYKTKAKLSWTSHSAFVQSNTTCVYIEPEVFVPNAFTPNGDGMNDEFRPFVSFFPSTYHLIIYNRAGIKVFESKNPKESWNGHIKGKGMAPGGTYIYYLKINNPDHEEIKKRGKVTVLYP